MVKRYKTSKTSWVQISYSVLFSFIFETTTKNDSLYIHNSVHLNFCNNNSHKSFFICCISEFLTYLKKKHVFNRAIHNWINCGGSVEFAFSFRWHQKTPTQNAASQTWRGVLSWPPGSERGSCLYKSLPEGAVWQHFLHCRETLLIRGVQSQQDALPDSADKDCFRLACKSPGSSRGLWDVLQLHLQEAVQLLQENCLPAAHR